MEVIYAHDKSIEKDIDFQLNYFLKSNKNFYRLYITVLSIFKSLHQYSIKINSKNSKNFLKDESDIFYLKFSKNLFGKRLGDLINFNLDSKNDSNINYSLAIDILRKHSGFYFEVFDSAYNEVGWFYPSSGSTTTDKMVVYNYVENAWSISELPRDAWDDAAASSDLPIAVQTVNDTGFVYSQETGFNDDGSPLTAYIETADFDIGDGDHFSFVRRLLPDCAFVGSSTDPQLTYTIKTRDNAGGALTAESATSVTTSSEFAMSNVRARARQIRVRVESTDLDNGWRLGDVRLDVRPDGRR